MRSHRNLTVWQRASDVAVTVFRLTSGYPRSELFGLSAQMRRAAVSVVSNIAEGSAKGTDREFHRFLDIAMGSAGELQAQLDLSERLGLGDPSLRRQAHDQVDEVKRMTASLMHAVQQRMRRSGTGA